MINCEICEKKSGAVFKEKLGEYTLWECLACRVQFWTPMKNPGAEHYEKDERYAFRNLNPLKSPERNHREFIKDSVVLLRRGFGGQHPTLLDVGMGTGNFLAAAVAAGYDSYGIDFDRDAIKAARESGLQNVFETDVNGALVKFGANYFDAITMFEVLEHLDNPANFVTGVKKLLNKDGYLAISVPYRLTPHYLKLGDIPPRHLTRWNKTAMSNFLQQNGFEILRFKIIPVSISYLITKFHFWFKGILSFDLVQKIANAGVGRESGDALALTSKIIWLQRFARLKDYVLFLVPSLVLYICLWLTNKHGLGLYVLARLAK